MAAVDFSQSADLLALRLTAPLHENCCPILGQSKPSNRMSWGFEARSTHE